MHRRPCRGRIKYPTQPYLFSGPAADRTLIELTERRFAAFMYYRLYHKEVIRSRLVETARESRS